MTDWEKIQHDFEHSDLTMAALAKKHDVNASTLRSRRYREKWKRDDATQQKLQRNKEKRVATEKVVKQLNKNDDLTEKQKQFCLLYLRYFNATKAYQETYDSAYSTARVEGSRLLANPSVKKELDRLKEAQRKELYIDSLDVKQAWLKQAFADITDFVEFGQEEYEVVDEFSGETETKVTSYVRLKESSEVDGTLIQEVKRGRDGVSVRLYDKQKAMDRIMEFLTELEGTDDDKVVIINNLNDDRMKEWVEENGGL